MATETNNPNTPEPFASARAGETMFGITLGSVTTGVFYLAITMFPHPWIHRYFLGHPVCVGATLLFAIAGGILLIKSLHVAAEARILAGIRDAELSPNLSESASLAEKWVHKHDAGRVSKAWLQSLADLPPTVRASGLLIRLTELLQRQSCRVSTRHLADDLREVSAREADAAHDSLQLVRIIIWAIPMLGFLGTVVGITQTLGDLDFSNGAAAVDQLKKGLYVAFDTTAIGLVLSVIAIFLQYPVENAEQRLLGDVDRRIGSILVTHLPPDDTADNPAGQIADLCDGIRIAVGQSLASQTELWRQTIDEAHLHWQRIAEDNGQRIGDAIVQTLAPLLREHAATISLQTSTIVDHIAAMQEQSRSMDEQSTALDSHGNALQDHSEAIANLNESAMSEWDRHASQWSELNQHHDQLMLLQSSLDNNLLRLTEANESVSKAIELSAGEGMSNAMMTLASAVEVLATKLGDDHSSDSLRFTSHDHESRRAA